MPSKDTYWISEQPPKRYAESISLSPFAMCAYSRLYWACFSKHPLPDDDTVLARIAALKATEWKRVRHEVEPLFDINEKGWISPVMMHAIAEAEDKRRQKAEAGSKGGKAAAENRRKMLQIIEGKANDTA